MLLIVLCQGIAEGFGEFVGVFGVKELEVVAGDVADLEGADHAFPTVVGKAFVLVIGNGGAEQEHGARIGADFVILHRIHVGFADLNDAQRTRGGFAFVEQRPGLIGFGFAFPAAFEAGGDALREAFDFAPNVTAAQTPTGSEPFGQGEHADADAGVFGIEHDEMFGGFAGGAELLGHFVGNEPAKAVATDVIGPFRLDGLHQGDKVMGGGRDIFPRQQPRIIGQGGGLDDVNRGVRTELGQECAVKERAAIAAMKQEERCAAGAFLQAGEGAAGSTQERAGARVVDGFG